MVKWIFLIAGIVIGNLIMFVFYPLAKAGIDKLFKKNT